jgi:hypothetical protein
MAKRPPPKPEDIKELAENEEFISRDDLDIEVYVGNDEPIVYVKIHPFEDFEDAEEYAEFLHNTLPLLLFETTKIQ